MDYYYSESTEPPAMRQPLVTFIVPVYNTGQYVAQCIGSLVHQSMQNHRVIIVNDGSTDQSGAVCRQFAQDHPSMVTYIEQQNRGQGAARNAGLSRTTTPYVAFLDGDDWMNSLFVERLTGLLRTADTQPDIIFTLPWLYDQATKNISPWMDMAAFSEIFAHPQERSVRSEPRLYDLEVSACRKVFRTAFLQGLGFSFPEGVKWEDVEPHFRLLHAAQTCLAMREASFYYRVNTGTQTTAGTSTSRLDMIPVFLSTLSMCDTDGLSAEERLHVLRLIVAFSRWSIRVTNAATIGQLVKGLHRVYKTVPRAQWGQYLSRLSKSPNSEGLFIRLLRGPLHMTLTNRGRTKRLFAALHGIHARMHRRRKR